MALLRLCASLKTSEHEIQVMHIDHGRRESSLKDSDFVREACAQLQLRFHLTRLETMPEGQNFEAWARTRRYQEFRKKCEEESLTCTFTAHTADDVVETLLMRLLSNKKPRSILEFDSTRMIFRPLLEHRKSLLFTYLQDLGQGFVHDHTNDDNAFLRNRVRNELRPFLVQHFGAEVESSLYQQARALDARELALDELANNLLKSLCQSPWGSKKWLQGLRELLNGQPEPFKERVLEQSFLPELGYRISQSKASELLRMLDGMQTATQLPGNYTVRRKDSGWILGRTSK